MKEKIWTAIVETLDTNADKKNIDELLTDAVMQVIESAIPNKVAVKYVGKRKSYSDGIFETGNWQKDQVKLVTADTAKKMLKHPDVYDQSKGEVKGVEVIDDQPEKEDDDNASHLEEARDAVMGLRSKKAVTQWVSDKFSGAQLTLDAKATVGDARLEAIRMIDMYHVAKQ